MTTGKHLRSTLPLDGLKASVSAFILKQWISGKCLYIFANFIKLGWVTLQKQPDVLCRQNGEGRGRSATFILFFPFIVSNNLKHKGHHKSKGGGSSSSGGGFEEVSIRKRLPIVLPRCSGRKPQVGAG